MTKKDYIKIAKIIKDNTLIKDNDKMLASVNKTCLVWDLCVMFKEDNSNFSNERFIDACDVMDDQIISSSQCSNKEGHVLVAFFIYINNLLQFYIYYYSAVGFFSNIIIVINSIEF